MEEIDMFLEDGREQMQNALTRISADLLKIRAGKAMPSMLDGLSIDYYGASTPLSQVASINTPDARTLLIKPWEKTLISEIEKAIINSDLGFNPQNDGENVIINIPMLTEERRRDLVKQVKGEGEQGKVRVRNIRKEINDQIKKLQKDGVSEDAIKSGEEEVQNLTNEFTKKIDTLLVKKEEEIMTV